VSERGASDDDLARRITPLGNCPWCGAALEIETDESDEENADV
jgi:hypothetical protein